MIMTSQVPRSPEVEACRECGLISSDTFHMCTPDDSCSELLPSIVRPAKLHLRAPLLSPQVPLMPPAVLLTLC